MPALFALTLFVSAALLFLVQPMVARMILPLLGGTPAVWNTCMVFFQATLLAGYAYSHAAPARLGVRPHAAFHLVLLLVPVLVLPLSLPSDWVPPASSFPVGWLLALLLLTVGLPFFVISTTGPLLQKWFASTNHPSAHDPYFLYAASNLGSMLALLSYPFLLEPAFTLSDQRTIWSVGYGGLVILTTACAVQLWRSPTANPEKSEAGKKSISVPPLTWLRRGRWVVLAFVPSSLMLSVTTYLTTDLAAIPLLWVLPLSLYLLTFILVFARKTYLSRPVLLRWMPLVVLVLMFLMLSEATEPVGLLILLHLVGLFWIGMVCHGELAHDRPPAIHLTEFYLWLSVGGVLGGLFNALLAPVLFNSVVEYPLVLVLACLLRPALEPVEESPIRGTQGANTPRSPRSGKGSRSPQPQGANVPRPPGFQHNRLDYLLPLGLGLVTAGLVLGIQALGLEPGPLSVGLMFGVPMLICYTFLHHPIRFGLGIGALFLAGSLYHGVYGSAQYRLRSFFGVHRVTLDPTGNFWQLIHGTTVHGQQKRDTLGRPEPLTYYHRTGPIGHVFATLQGDPRLQRVGVIGLGVGALASYAEEGQHWTYFEIDPAVVHIAQDSGYFTFLSTCPAKLDVVLGDARLTLDRGEDRFGLLVIDAFSSDAIPIHLLTREALDIYREHLTPNAIMAFNISNRYLDLRQVLADLAHAVDPPMVCFFREDLHLSDSERDGGKAPSQWVVMGNQSAVEKLRETGQWQELRPGKNATRVWTDDYSNVFQVLK